MWYFATIVSYLHNTLERGHKSGASIHWRRCVYLMVLSEHVPNVKRGVYTELKLKCESDHFRISREPIISRWLHKESNLLFTLSRESICENEPLHDIIQSKIIEFERNFTHFKPKNFNIMRFLWQNWESSLKILPEIVWIIKHFFGRNKAISAFCQCKCTLTMSLPLPLFTLLREYLQGQHFLYKWIPIVDRACLMCSNMNLSFVFLASSCVHLLINSPVKNIARNGKIIPQCVYSSTLHLSEQHVKFTLWEIPQSTNIIFNQLCVVRSLFNGHKLYNILTATICLL